MSLNLKQRAERTAKDVIALIKSSENCDPDSVASAIEETIIKALVEERHRCADMAFEHVCPEDRDRAHKIAEDIRNVKSVLIANLSSMR